ncbi:MAG TPA: type II toxin-antitoxin system prevent-host-death family antitoxin [Trueperaceae bacterium]
MEVKAKELRSDTKRILDAVERGEEVIVTYRGKPRAKMTAIGVKKRSMPDFGNSPLFGMWSDHEATENVVEYVDRLRKGRF